MTSERTFLRFVNLLQSIQGSGPNGRIVAEDVEKFIKEGGAKAKPEAKKAKDTQAAPSKPAKKDKETAARAGGYDEQQVSDLRAVNDLWTIKAYHRSGFLLVGKCSSCY